jgi:hypothetical protein
MAHKQTQVEIPRGATRDFGTMTTATASPEEYQAATATASQRRKRRTRLGTSFVHDKHNTARSFPLLFGVLWTLLRRANCELGFQVGVHTVHASTASSLRPPPQPELFFYATTSILQRRPRGCIKNKNPKNPKNQKLNKTRVYEAP